jgi:hypothetical protein
MPPTFPSLKVSSTPEQIVSALSNMSKRGRLAGFAKAPAGTGDLFVAEAWGSPFESELIARAEPSEGGVLLSFRVRMLRKMPWIFAAVLAFAIWPGVWFTQSLLDTYFPGSLVAEYTYWWYLPLTALPIPFSWRSMMRKSRSQAEASAAEQIQKIARELNATQA